MDIYGQIGKKLKEIAGSNGGGLLVFSAEIIKTSGNTCDIKIGDLPLSDVRLKSVVNDNENELLVTPAVGSHVLVADLSNGNFRDLAVIKYEEIEAIKLKTKAGIEFEVKDDKISLKNKSYDLKKAFDELLDAITKLTVTTGVGPSGTPINLAEFTAVKQKLNTLLK